MVRKMRKSKLFTTLSVVALLSASLTSIGYADGLKLKQGDQGPQVLEAEQLLHKLGWYVEVDTKYDRYTVRAVKKFQQKHGIRVTGVIDNATMNRLKQEGAAYDSAIGKPVPTPQPSKPAPEKPVVVQPPVVKPPVVRPPVVQPPVVNPAPVTPGNTGITLSAEEQQMIELMNQERAKSGLQSVKPNAKLMELARLKAKDMVDNHYFSHNSPTYGSPFKMMQSGGVAYKKAAENIAGNRSVAAAHLALMNSEGHRANIMTKEFNQVGIGIVPGGPYGTMYVQMFIQQ
ncbi:peptidoglycan-binding protein [Paenibacillus sp. MER TA 81-3]|uniref:CAP domain-containing protein n=1 Tax=Paenibacillus sp. MER TA 81-3 TaxID=2939573 RepID=UPI00203DE84E|nr:CAP domain-containing protein [Paenibacillus sp. MER TA 81-3]MCM3338183.1 peptidoglycan-binding protein [Paenibacillus sp. MER TA 81-3]